MIDWLLVLAGAAVGALVRYLIGVDAKYRFSTGFPWGTLAANATSCLVLGFVAQSATDGGLGHQQYLLLATGFCGALSAWSTFSYELLTMTSARRTAVAGGYLLTTLAAGLVGAFAGATVANTLF
ncbi:fluoride efflux transporter FluC [Streptomyces althioticus]|uniref:fluoride efflux transporter FluC n=1 Tax=Streptomyces TaxID=1883 RepID=UPI00073AB84A|nr:CrcB family protein [Streptomyces lusitanus]ALV48202.1 chromosome condensation protein CrcB [Streptomyces sp. 4F]MCC9690545.1 CrcB family protein [Streptomyces sp. MNU103]